MELMPTNNVVRQNWHNNSPIHVALKWLNLFDYYLCTGWAIITTKLYTQIEISKNPN